MKLGIWIGLLGLVLSAGVAHGQGSLRFTIAITGEEIVGGQNSPVRGGGSLELFGSTLQYNIFVPVTVLPDQTHFHGPRVGEEMPQFSVPQYEREGLDGIRYRAAFTFDPKYVPDIRAGRWYIQLHSPNYVNGVLRGDILPVPEPGSSVLMLTGLVCLAVMKRRRGISPI